MAKKPPLPMWLLPAALIYAAGFAVAAIWDLSLNIALYTPFSPLALIMEAFGWYPAFLPPILCAMLLVRRGMAARRHTVRSMACACLATVGVGLLFIVSANYLVKRRVLQQLWGLPTLPWLLAVFAAFAGLWVLLCHLPNNTHQRLFFACMAGSAFLILNQSFVYVLKLFWARTRFDDMAAMGSFAQFTPWYLPMGFGGSSFPSGHTANAAGVFALLFLCDLFPSWQRKRRLVCALCWCYVGLMALARILMGRHFLSDTLASSLIMALLFFGISHTHAYRQGVQGFAKGE